MTPVQVYAAMVAHDASAVFNQHSTSRDYYIRRLKLSTDSLRSYLVAAGKRTSIDHS